MQEEVAIRDPKGSPIVPCSERRKHVIITSKPKRGRTDDERYYQKQKAQTTTQSFPRSQ